MTSTFAVVLSALLGILLCTPAGAEDPPRSNVRRLAYDTRVDLAVTSVGAVWLATSELLKPVLVPEKCRWCYRGEDGTDLLNPYDSWVRRQLIWKQPHTADITSSIIAFAIEPLSTIGLNAVAAANDRNGRGVPVDALLVMEATMIAGNVNQIAKYAFARERPFVHYLPRAPKEVRKLTASPSDDNLSFFSGHTTLAFAVATSSGTVSSLRGYRLAPLVWAAGLTMAASVGYLRMAGDKHYFSDVMTGVVVGCLIGAGVPLLFHSAKSSADANPPSPSGLALSGAPVRNAFSLDGAW